MGMRHSSISQHIDPYQIWITLGTISVAVYHRVLDCELLWLLQTLLACAVLFNIAESYSRHHSDQFRHNRLVIRVATLAACIWVAALNSVVPLILLAVLYLSYFAPGSDD
jgi:hypothetical protein